MNDRYSKRTERKVWGTRKLLTGQSRLAADRPPQPSHRSLSGCLHHPHLTSHHITVLPSSDICKSDQSTQQLTVYYALSTQYYFNVQTQIHEIAYREKMFLIILSPIHCVFYQLRDSYAGFGITI